MIPRLISRLYIDERVICAPLTRRILSQRGRIDYEVTTDRVMQSRVRNMTLSRGKRILYVTRQDGGLVKPCPATLAPYLCCRYTVINQASQCPLDCTYCILQDYLESPVITVNANLDDVFTEVDAVLTKEPKRFFRFGTGELTDSLVLDEITGLSGTLSTFFSKKKNCVLELKTKTASVNELIRYPSERIVVSWSLNPSSVVKEEEHGAASIEERLKAAQKCMDRGFLLGFHFDPILRVDGFDDVYRELVDELFRYVDGNRIAWISLGSLRFPVTLKPMIQDRFPKTRIVYEEMIRGLDGKMRYPRPLRVDLFKKMYEWLKGHAPELFIYFCMEPSWVWESVVGTSPSTNAELDYWFAKSLYKRFPSLGMVAPMQGDYS